MIAESASCLRGLGHPTRQTVNMSDHESGMGSAPDGFEAAAEYLEAELVPRRSGPLAKATRSVVSIIAGMVAGDLESGPSSIDLLVTRRETGNEVLRVSAGSLTEADRLLMQVRRDLETKSVSEFIHEWRLPSGDAPPA